MNQSRTWSPGKLPTRHHDYVLRNACVIIGRSVVMVLAIAAAIFGTSPIAVAGLTCPPTGIITAPNLPTTPARPGFVAALFDHYYTAWSDRLSQPDMALSSSSVTWTKVPEFADLIRVKLFLPFMLERMKAGDFRLVPAVECITGIDSVRLFPNPLPPPGKFGLQDVAALWVTQGGQVFEDDCRTRCAGDKACEQNCSDERHQYWGP